MPARTALIKRKRGLHEDHSRFFVLWRKQTPAQDPWDSSEWWDTAAREVSGACGKCGGTLRGVYTVFMTHPVLTAHCIMCGAERVLLFQEGRGQAPIVPGPPTPKEAEDLERLLRSEQVRIAHRRYRGRGTSMTRVLLHLTLWCTYAYEVIWYEFLPPTEWATAVKALCG